MLVLFASASLYVLSAYLASPRSMPDERHHYALTKYLAEHPTAFPVPYHEVWTDREGDHNHLGHPPLYYYTMAFFYRAFAITKDLTFIGRAQDTYGRFSSSHVIPLLRSISILLSVLGLIGIFYLLEFLVQHFQLPPWAAVIAALLFSFIPGFSYIGGALNNDVLTMTFWPFVVLSVLQFIVFQNFAYFWKSAVFFGISHAVKGYTLASCCRICVYSRYCIHLNLSCEGTNSTYLRKLAKCKECIPRR